MNDFTTFTQLIDKYESTKQSIIVYVKNYLITLSSLIFDSYSNVNKVTVDCSPPETGFPKVYFADGLIYDGKYTDLDIPDRLADLIVDMPEITETQQKIWDVIFKAFDIIPTWALEEIYGKIAFTLTFTKNKVDVSYGPYN